MRHIIFLLTTSLVLICCGQSDTKQKEFELKKRELALKEKEMHLKEKDTINKVDTIPANTTEPSKQSTADKTTAENNLSDKEYGEYSFTIPTGSRPYWITISLILGSNKTTLTDAGYSGGDVIEGKDNGTFTVDKVNDEFKYITCKFKKQGVYKLKYSTKKKKWILLNASDLAPEIESD